MRVAVIGAGLTGLTTAYRLLQKGHQVAVFEKKSYAGGLAAGFRGPGWDWSLEYFFHHTFTSDNAIIGLISELGLSEKFFSSRPKSSIFFRGELERVRPSAQSPKLRPSWCGVRGGLNLCHTAVSQFDSPLSVLKFPYLSFAQRLRVGLVTAYLKCVGTARRFENFTAAEWLAKFYGRRAYQIIWEPLLKAKFGDKADRISMVWFWARVKKRSARLGYLEGGFQCLIRKLVEEIEEGGGCLYLNCEVGRLDFLKRRRGVVVFDRRGQTLSGEEFDRVVVTTPISVFLRIIPGLPTGYVRNLRRLNMLGALNLILALKEPFLADGTYWLNINEPGFPFVAVVEHTNFVSSKHYGDHCILYVGGYYPQNHRYFRMSKEEIFEEFLPYLEKINSGVRESTVGSWLSADLYAQPVVSVNYSQMIPGFKTPLSNVFLANMQMITPWDRGMNYAVEMGEKVAGFILES